MTKLVQFIRRDNQRHTRWLHRYPIKACLISVAIGYLSATATWALVYEPDRAWPMIALLAATYAIWMISYYRDCKKLGWTIGIAVGLWAVSAQGQVIQFWETSYRKTVTYENNLGLIWPSWYLDSKTTEALDTNGVVVNRAVYWDGATLGRLKYYAPKRIETILVYNRSAGPINGQEIVFDRPKAAVGVTNPIPANAMPALDWLPVVGTEQIGNDYWRITTRGSPMVCWGRNMSTTSPYLLRIPVFVNGRWTNLLFRFEPGQSKSFTIGGAGFMRIYFDGATEQQLPW